MPPEVISVVVPTRDRHQIITRLLRILSDQFRPGCEFEVVVADDGSTDRTPELIEEQRWPFPLRVVRQNNAGAATARNAGARAASGDVLLFLDDDVEPEDGLIGAHAGAHAGARDLVALGDLPPIVSGRSFMGVMLRTWWGSMQEAVRRPGHRYGYRDLLSGHFSIRRSDLERLGGFDRQLRCREDYELGYRAIASGFEFRHLPDAVARHHDTTDVEKAIRRKFDEGLADVQIVQRHPALAPSLPLGRGPAHRGLQGRMMRLGWRDPRAGERATRAMRSALPSLERMRLRRRWRSFLNGLLTYWYWRGVALAIGSRQNLEALLATAPAPAPPLTVDLAHGITAAEDRLDTHAPRAALLVYGTAPIGTIPDEPGAEPLGGRHLRPLLATVFRWPYLRAVCADGAIPPPLVVPAAALAVRESARERGAALA